MWIRMPRIKKELSTHTLNAQRHLKFIVMQGQEPHLKTTTGKIKYSVYEFQWHREVCFLKCLSARTYCVSAYMNVYFLKIEAHWVQLFYSHHALCSQKTRKYFNFCRALCHEGAKIFFSNVFLNIWEREKLWNCSKYWMICWYDTFSL